MVDSVEVKVDVTVEVVEFNSAVAVEFGDFEIGIWRKQILKRFIH